MAERPVLDQLDSRLLKTREVVRKTREAGDVTADFTISTAVDAEVGVPTCQVESEFHDDAETVLAALELAIEAMP